MWRNSRENCWDPMIRPRGVMYINKNKLWPCLCSLGLVQTPYFSCAEPNWISSNWNDTGATSDSDGVPCVEPQLSSTKVRQTLSNLTLLPHQTKTAVPNWFRRCSFAVLNSSVRFGTWVERRLNQALLCTNKLILKSEAGNRGSPVIITDLCFLFNCN